MNKQMIYHSLDELDGNYKRQPSHHVRADGLRDYSYAAIAADPYGVQGVIMREVNYVGSGELAIGSWSQSVGKDRLLEFGNKVAALSGDNAREYTGVRIVRNTNVSSGYAIFSIQLQAST